MIAAILIDPSPRLGKVYELTGPRSEDMKAIAAEHSSALGQTVTYVDVPFKQWRDDELRKHNLPEHLYEHLLTMARLHAANRYDRLSRDVETIIRCPALSVHNFVRRHAQRFTSVSKSTNRPTA